jgi:dihydrofolate reductase
MGKIALSQHMSLDGVMQSPGPTDVPFKYRGWIMDFDRGPEGDRFQLEQAQNSEALLLGRVTYEAMQAFWPTAEGEFADRLNELPKYVVSSTLTDPPWNATVLGDDWPEEVARLRKELDGEIVVYGSRRLSQALIGMGLVDELRQWSTRWCSAREIACSARRKTRSRCAWSNRVRSREAW